ncbi:MAG: hypothetical protein PHW56_01695 [Methanosarcinaceae archaeon]|nr:hypothetical protein [Methanosarcinaceae archaeon]
MEAFSGVKSWDAAEKRGTEESDAAAENWDAEDNEAEAAGKERINIKRTERKNRKEKGHEKV